MLVQTTCLIGQRDLMVHIGSENIQFRAEVLHRCRSSKYFATVDLGMAIVSCVELYCNAFFFLEF